MSTLPSEAVFEAFNASTATHFRRVEIYEADGKTRWGPDMVGSRLISGSVSVDYARDERRTLELELSNYDGVLENTPGKFWYDKVIKAFRGVVVNEPKKLPNVLVFGNPDNAEPQAIRDSLYSMGYTKITVAEGNIGIRELQEYDIIAHGGYILPGQAYNLIEMYERGKSILTFGAQDSSFKWFLARDYAATISEVGYSDAQYPIIRPSSSHAVAIGWSYLNMENIRPEQGNERQVQVTRKAWITNPDRRSVADDGTYAWVSAFGEPNASRGQWVIFHPNFGTVDTAWYGLERTKEFMLAAMKWLDPLTATVTWETQVGEFMIDRISEGHFPPVVKVTCRDYTKKAMKSKFLQATQFPKGVAMEELVASIAGAAGVTNRLLPRTGVTVQRSFFFDRGATRWEAMKEIANAHDYELFFDARGFLVMRPQRDPLLTSPIISFRTGTEYGNLVTYEKSTSDSRIYNVILVAGESSDPDTIPVWATARNDNPLSPTSTQRLGERSMEYTSSFITTKKQAQEVADSFLAINALEEYEINFSSLLYPWLEAGDIMEFLDPKRSSNEPTTFLISSLTIPLGLAPMDGTGKRLIKVI